MELIPSCQALPKDQEKNKMATAKVKVENLMGSDYKGKMLKTDLEAMSGTYR